MYDPGYEQAHDVMAKKIGSLPIDPLTLSNYISPFNAMFTLAFFSHDGFFFTLLVSPNWVSYLVPSCLSFWSLGCVTPALAGDVKALRAIVNILINELIN